MSTGIAISASGTNFPETIVGNDELCAAFNEYVRRENARQADAIAAGTAQPLAESSPEFVLKASGIRERRLVDKTGILDPDRMCPNIPDRPDNELSIQAEMSVKAAEQALERAGRCGEDIDMVILATANLQRLYPAIGIEVQAALGARGFAYDLAVGCSSGTFPIQIACDALRTGNASCALVVNPEIMCGHANWRDRDSHFIFGDAGHRAGARAGRAGAPGSFEILGTRSCRSTRTRSEQRRLPQPLRPATHVRPGQALLSAGPQGLQGRGPAGLALHDQPPGVARIRARSG
jgi:beta-ketodecanoyl-[acyl-carrier-protein] synthase